MFSDAPILIVEDNLYLALDLSIAVEEMAGQVVGPASTIDEALALIGGQPVAAAIVDCRLGDRDASPVTRELTLRQVPFVIHTTTPLAVVGGLHPEVPVLIKPLRPGAILTCLLNEIRRSGGLPNTGAAAPRLG